MILICKTAKVQCNFPSAPPAAAGAIILFSIEDAAILPFSPAKDDAIMFMYFFPFRAPAEDAMHFFLPFAAGSTDLQPAASTRVMMMLAIIS